MNGPWEIVRDDAVDMAVMACTETAWCMHKIFLYALEFEMET